MRRLLFALGTVLVTGTLCAQTPEAPGPQPIYHVTVVSRTLQAVNYEHRGGPTPIDFRGTVLLPDAKGTAVVDSHRGSVSIDAKLEHLQPPTRFGREYLTYVLWAITPEGRPRNLGEVLVDSSNKAHIKVTTNLQTFGMIITAEPYYSVTTPSNVVVAENVVRPDTIGTREEVTAKYELLPRGQYTMTIQPGQLQSVSRDQQKLSYDRYEALLELYQAQNAVQIARSLGAAQYAAESFSKAASLLNQAQSMNARKMNTDDIITTAREAAQMAEDARTIAVRRRDEAEQAEKAERERKQSELQRQQEEQAEQAQVEANRDAAQRAAAEQARAQAEQARIEARQRAVRPAPPRAALAPQPAPRAALAPHPPRVQPEAAQRRNRAQLFAQLDNTLKTRDTPRGLVVTIGDSMFESGNDLLRNDATKPLVTLAQILAAHPDLRVRIEGYADSQPLSTERAQAVRSALIAGGASGNEISAAGYGNTRPIASQTTAAGRAQNRRVEVVIYGNSIGNTALWDRSYPLRSRG